MVAIELGTCRSGRSGGSSGFITFRNGNVRERRGGTSSRGGNRLPLGDEETVSRDAECRMMMEATPPAPLVMSEPEFLLELLIVSFDAPAQLGDIDQLIESNVFRKIGKPVLGWSLRVSRPFNEQPLFFLASQANADARKTRRQPLSRALSPSDGLPSAFGKGECDILDGYQVRVFLACLRQSAAQFWPAAK